MNEVEFLKLMIENLVDDTQSISIDRVEDEL